MGNFKETWEILGAVLEENVDPTKTALRVVGLDSNIIDSGKATSGSTGTLADTGKAWITNMFAGAYLKIIDGTNAGAIRLIASNTGTVITITGTFAAAIDSTSEYEIVSIATVGTNVTIVGDSVGLAKEAGGNLAAILTKQSDGNAKTKVVDGSGNVVGSTGNALDVNIKSGGGGGGAVTIADGADITLGAKADAKSDKTDTTAVTIMQVLKEISYMAQNPASQAVTNANLDIALSALRDAIAGASPNNKTLYDVLTGLIGSSSKTLTDVVSALASVPVTNANLDATISSLKTLLTDASQKTKVVDGSGNVIGATSNALDVNIKSGNISGFALETGGNLAAVKLDCDNLNGKNIPVLGVTATASGDTILRTPTTGKKTRVRYISFNNAGAVDITVYFKSATTGNVYQQLLRPGSIFATAIGLNNNYHELAVNEICYVNLSATGTVYCTIRYEEV